MIRSTFKSSAKLVALLTLAACGGTEPVPEAVDEPLVATPLPERVSRGDQPLFRRVPATASGVTFRNELAPQHVVPYIYNGAGVSVGDWDGDGRCDLYLVSQDGPNRLYRQTGNWQFEDVTSSVGPVDGGDAWGSGASFVDIDGDRDLDLYVCNTESPNRLYVNSGDGRFEERAASWGLDFRGASTMPAFADYDNDGDLDLYLVTNRALGPTLPPDLLTAIELPGEARDHVSVAQLAPVMPELERDRDGNVIIPPEFRDHLIELNGRVFFGGQADRLFRNDGERFIDVTDRAGIADQFMGLSATWWDYDDDGWLDIYVANDLESPDLLYHNNGNGTFEEVSNTVLPQLPYFGMGSDAADIDNDGDLDLIVADMASTTHYKSKVLMGDMADRAWFLSHSEPPQTMRNSLFVNTGVGRFLEAGYLAGVARTDWTWSMKFGDLDEDGRVDLFVTNGIPRFDNDPDIAARYASLRRQGKDAEALELVRSIPAVRERNLAFRNRPADDDAGVATFEDVASQWGLDLEGLSHGAAWADFDGDGDLDLVVNNLNDEAAIYENRSAANHRAVVVLRGRGGNRFGLGARVTIHLGDALQTRLLTLSHGYRSTDEPQLHFGLARHATIDRLEVRWPSGAVQTFTDLLANQRFVISEPPGPPPSATNSAPIEPISSLFTPAADRLGLDFSHRETEFDDFAAQPLLPHRLSRLGPGLAFGDANGDGHDDLFVGGAAGQPGQLYLRQPDAAHGFRLVSGPWNDDAECEDLGIAWIDFDADGDLDLFVVSGSVEGSGPAHEELRDRMYRNVGGRFEPTVGVVPDLRDSGSVVAAADFDRDGDLDLMIGSRVDPGQYPLSTPSRLLRNDAGRFTDVTQQLAPALLTAGMVTGACWSDIDDDGWVDLLVSAHWQPIRLLGNRQGRLEDHTEPAGLSRARGWFNGVASGDLDGDGDIDLVASNFGLNTKYHADPAHPARLFAADFDGNGVLDIIEAKQVDDRLLPVRGRSCSSRAMPFIGTKFPTFDQFARATIPEIYPTEDLAKATRLAVERLEHVALLNDGSGKFTLQSLPRSAQIAPGFGIALGDFNDDRRLDIYLGQNFYSAEPETGRMANGIGTLLEGLGKGSQFAIVDPKQSGMVVRGDAKAVATTDLDGDGRPDLVVSQNNGPLRVFTSGERKVDVARRRIAVRLRGRPGNPSAIGAKLTCQGQTHELQAGSGYLAGSSPIAFFTLGDDANEPASIAVRWPDGSSSVHVVEPSSDPAQTLSFEQPR